MSVLSGLDIWLLYLSDFKPVKYVIRPNIKIIQSSPTQHNIIIRPGLAWPIYQNEQIELGLRTGFMPGLHTTWFMVSFQLVHPFLMTSLPHHYSDWQKVIRSRYNWYQLLISHQLFSISPSHMSSPPPPLTRRRLRPLDRGRVPFTAPVLPGACSFNLYYIYN